MSPQFARRVFFWAGIYGLVTLLPLYLFESALAEYMQPATNRPEQYYGFVGVALAWQLAFLLISRDVVRFRPMMLPAIAEKLLFGVPVLFMIVAGRVTADMLPPVLIDLVLAVLFVLAYRATTSGVETTFPADRARTK